MANLRELRSELASRMRDTAMSGQPPDMYRHMLNRAQKEVWLNLLPISILGDKFYKRTTDSSTIGTYQYNLPSPDTLAEVVAVQLKYSNASGFAAEQARVPAREYTLEGWTAMVSGRNSIGAPSEVNPIFCRANGQVMIAPPPGGAYSGFIEFSGWAAPAELVNDDDEIEFQAGVEGLVVDFATVYMARQMASSPRDPDEMLKTCRDNLSLLLNQYGPSMVYARLRNKAGAAGTM